MKRSGTADLPLHRGRVPQWLATRMAQLGREIIIAIIEEYSPDEVLTRLSDPFWFQALGCVMGMDWHSSGITTSVMGALKKAINPLSAELGLFVCGGRGKHSRSTPQELELISNQCGLNGTELIRASKLSAKVDNSCVQDGFSIYLHNFIVSKTGQWTVIQQGMNQNTAMARRYHWHSPLVRSFVADPHTAVIGTNQGIITNLCDQRSAPAQKSIVAFLKEPLTLQLKELRHLTLDHPHEITAKQVNSKRLGAVLALAHEKQFNHFVEAIMLDGVGPRTLQALALIGEVIYGTPSRFDDPARFSFAHGGKDGIPFPVPLQVYDESISFLKKAVNRAKIDSTYKYNGLQKLGALSTYIEQNFSPYADINKVIAHEKKHSHKYKGRTIHGPVKPPSPDKSYGQQLSLFDSYHE